MNYNIEEFKGKTFIEIENQNTALIFKTADGLHIKMHHEQDCCESVTLEDIVGDLDDLLNTPILVAEKRQSFDNPKTDEDNSDYKPDSFTWTFFHFATKKGYVDLRWYGESNGYYSEDVGFTSWEEDVSDDEDLIL